MPDDHCGAPPDPASNESGSSPSPTAPTAIGKPGAGPAFIYRAMGPWGLACGRATFAWTTRAEAEGACFEWNKATHLPKPYVVDVLGGNTCPQCGASVLVSFTKMLTPNAYEATIERHNTKPDGPLCRAFVQAVWEEAP